jgi:uncharacterized protein YjbI with pentapeptide repeats
MRNDKFPCPCCFNLTLAAQARFEICEVCYWEDDGQDDFDAEVVRGGPNGELSLTHGRENYTKLQASNPLNSAKVRRPTPDELTDRSIRSIVPLIETDETAAFTLCNHNDGSEIETLQISCLPDAADPWRKRLAVLAAREAGRTASGDLLNFAELNKADLRDIDLSCQSGEVDFSHACLDEADMFLAVMHRVWMIGTKLRGANMRSVHMCDAVARYANFTGADLAGSLLNGTSFAYARFREANLRHVLANNTDFAEADLSGADMTHGSFEGSCFDNAILTGANITGAYFCGATFKGAILKGLDLATANFSGAIIDGAIIDASDFPNAPVVPDIHKKIYAAASKPGAFEMSAWHTCETTHCRAGWAVTLAGEAGAALEDEIGTDAAATLIYLVSDPDLKRIPDFLASNEDALADMKRLADEG